MGKCPPCSELDLGLSTILQRDMNNLKPIQKKAIPKVVMFLFVKTDFIKICTMFEGFELEFHGIWFKTSQDVVHYLGMN